MRQDDERCERCAFFVAFRDGDGECHIYAPSIDNNWPHEREWPAVTEQDWCGEFELVEGRSEGQ